MRARKGGSIFLRKTVMVVPLWRRHQTQALEHSAPSVGVESMYRIAAIGIVLALSATQALAHPKLLSSTPAEGASVTSPAQINLTFSEKLFDKLSGAKLIRADRSQATNVAVSVGSDGKSMQLVPASPLAAGSYTVEWHGVGGDTHRVTGAVRFTVR